MQHYLATKRLLYELYTITNWTPTHSHTHTHTQNLTHIRTLKAAGAFFGQIEVPFAKH